ncbi:MAG: cyclic nucleotide-binding domain-containing protein [Magnetococcales bacterium]|nr:cyclic nucleotide-binding domain-containing protein [Magnetococcales bacterium]
MGRELGKLYREGETIYRQGEKADSLFVVQKGQVELVVLTETGEYPLGRLKEGDCFGEVSLFAEKTRFSTARALGEARVLKVDQKQFIGQLHHDPSLAFRIMRRMAQRLYEQDHLLIGKQVEGPPALSRREPLEVESFRAFLQEEVGRARRLYQKLSLALLEVGNPEWLERLQEVLREQLRKTDVILPLVGGRLGVVLYEADGQAAMTALHKGAREFSRQNGGEPAFCGGVAVFPEYTESEALWQVVEDLLSAATLRGGDTLLLADPPEDFQGDREGAFPYSVPLSALGNRSRGWLRRLLRKTR